jgi:YgiT-type zinc finger domain-containing protein
MKCPCCGAAELIHDIRDMSYTYKGETTTIPTVTGDVNAFSRYENGKTKPPLALVKLLKVLERHTDLLDEVRTA